MAALALVAGASRITANSTRDRTISFYSVNTKETLTIQYMKDGKRIPEAMQKINWILRDWRKDEPTEMDPDLIDLVWEVHTELGSAEPIHIISGYRSRSTNDMLRRTVGGQASESRHILGKAMDVHFPDVPVKKLRYSALIRERGGVGYYPTSATPFVHLDTDRVRAWPRLPRTELALLFPSGRTQHQPSDGGSITPEDVRRARAADTELAAQIAEFHQLRTQPKPPVQVASLTPSLPQLMSLPRLVQRPPAEGTRPTDSERARLAALADEPLPSLVVGPTPVSRKRSAADVPAWGEMRVAAADPGTATAADRLETESLAQSRHLVRAGTRLRRGAPRGAVLSPLPDRAVPDGNRLGRRSRARPHRPSRPRQDAGDAGSGWLGAAHAAAAGLADGAALVGAAVQGRGDQPLEPHRPRSRRRPGPARQAPRRHPGAIKVIRNRSRIPGAGRNDALVALGPGSSLRDVRDDSLSSAPAARAASGPTRPGGCAVRA